MSFVFTAKKVDQQNPDSVRSCDGFTEIVLVYYCHVTNYQNTSEVQMGLARLSA